MAKKISGVDWVSFFSLLVIALALLAMLKSFTGNGAATREELNSSEVPERGSPVAAFPDEKVLNAMQVADLDTHPGFSAEHSEVQVEEATPVELLGVSVQLRELRARSEDGESGDIRNIEFFIREGIRPRQLFEGTSQRVIRYWPLYHNNVGFGASTVRILYLLVDTDSDGDGELTRADTKSVAFSLPDGSNYRVLDRNVGDITDMTYLSDASELQLEFSQGGEIQRRVYSLATTQQ